MWALSSQFCFKQAGIPFTEIKVRFDAFTPDSTFKKTVNALTPADAGGSHLGRELAVRRDPRLREKGLVQQHQPPASQAVIERV
jgi:hypothetical protein